MSRERNIQLGELERTIAAAFNTAELSKFAEPLGVMLDREGGTEQGARALVRALERNEQLGRLRARLDEAKPLVEWPEVEDLPPAAPGEDNEAPDADEEAPEIEPEHQPSERGSGPETGHSSPPPEATIPVSERAAAPIVDPTLSSGEESRFSRRDLVIAAVAIALGGSAIGAGVSRLLDGRRAGEVAPSDTPVALAHLAANHLSVSVDAVARACDAESTQSSARQVLSLAFQRCSERVVPASPRSGGRAPLAYDDRPPPPRPAKPPRVPIDARGAAKRAPEKPEPCIVRCNELHDGCRRDDCGREPQQSSKYPAYQRCLARCLTDASRCRLGCR